MTQNPPELPTKLMVFAEVLLELGDSPTSVAKHEAPHEGNGEGAGLSLEVGNN